MSTYDEKVKCAEDKIRPLLTDGFLRTLRVAVKTCGYSVDHVESSQFVGWCFDLAGKEEPETEPFEYDED